MAFGLGQDINASTICPAADNFPNIRLLVFTNPGATWEVASSKTACTGTGFSPFSAVCFYFGMNTFQNLGGDVPVGLVYSAVGGTSIERWSGPDALAQCNQTGVVQQSNLWIPHIIPLLPMRMSGWTWYQGGWWEVVLWVVVVMPVRGVRLCAPVLVFMRPRLLKWNRLCGAAT
jgi:hypothetical protein